MSGNGKNGKDKPPANDDRQTRLAQALRANLRKRKAQARARRTSGERPSDRRSEQD
ncbi:hypothetical protein [Dichotomicrobium thermohalophilum]|uniref:Uncharacterized protein n=1 Tax=Dichotomicrobium thermohalophilum TaxID=933063 RepID=A0A397Q1M4_9HYPH|nr:hypothetical protein [Dichotomicrobium thermohalophilum]RIA55400.1 hypothetical protein BXY53_0465 [Dichotomicrobium thermohalophilum]